MRKKQNKFLSLLVAAFMVFSIMPVKVSAIDTDNKIITVGGENGDYTTIQEAINFIDEQADKTYWTIEVSSGTYNRFTVLDGMNNLTVKAVDGESVIINTLDNSPAPAPTSGGYPDTAGISIRNATEVTLDGLNINVGTQANPWYSAAISTYSQSVLKGNKPTVKNCTFYGSGTGIGVFINTGVDGFYVNNCEFNGLKEAISMYGDGILMKGADVSSNTFNNCSFALHGYYGGTGEAGTLSFVNNTVNGTDLLRCKVVVQDQVNSGAIKVDIHDNTLINAVVGLVNLREDGETVSDVLESNTMGKSSFYVEAIEPGTIEFYTTYNAPENEEGYWVLTGIEDFEDGTYDYIKNTIKEANDNKSKTISFTGIDEDNLIKTFTWFKDGLYWVSSDKTSYPGLDKKIVINNEDGTTTEVDNTSVSKGDTINFKLTSNVPQDLKNYLKPDTPDEPSFYSFTDELNSGIYKLAFNDIMDSGLTLVDSSIHVTANGKDVKVSPVIGADEKGNTTIYVEIELVALYEAGYFTDDDLGTAPIIMTYSATANSDIIPGTYYNKAWVDYEGGKTEEDVVTVDTFGIQIFKYDQKNNEGLKGAKFELKDSNGNLIATLISGEDGYVSYEGLKAGEYTLTETAAPNGYVKSDKPITIILPDNVSGETKIANVKFANSVIPHTGGTGTMMFTIVGVVIIGVACVFFATLQKRKKRTNLK
ncbi:MAG: isopeptide-forming domain-containing fimbrial protein [Clostridium sp.]|uniref:SpaA isopeptide-forming pilin-related protein n=1 Tax=Clostridium sp. TaxID=1506 RepID=UPI0025BC9F7E|nr:SpaA isopeptide-forming pilin-related protein [Clostridium sp.]MCF0147301.1 isopeptide-forming domain-containing fimbrial protein [Clostridium sp.]